MTRGSLWHPTLVSRGGVVECHSNDIDCSPARMSHASRAPVAHGPRPIPVSDYQENWALCLMFRGADKPDNRIRVCCGDAHVEASADAERDVPLNRGCAPPGAVPVIRLQMERTSTCERVNGSETSMHFVTLEPRLTRSATHR